MKQRILNNAARISKAAGAIMLLAALPLVASSCKGRTAENMTPDGETVEVNVGEGDTSAEPVIDTVATDSVL